MTKNVFPFILGGSEMHSQRKLAVKFPYTGETVFKISTATKEELRTALNCATLGAELARNMSVYERVKVLLNISRLIEERSEDLVETIILEAGKPRKYAVAEVKRAIQTFRFAGEVLEHYENSVIHLDLRPGTEGKKGIISRFPIGVVAAITPFNFPLNLVAHKYAPNIMAGNAIIHKPASKTPVTAYKLARIVLDAGYPMKAMSMLPMSSTTAMFLAETPKVKGLTFTGSAPVGWSLKKKAYDKKVTLELGGDAAAIICKDTENLEEVAEHLAMAGTAYAGQVCISLQRLFVHEDIYEEFKEIFVEKMKRIPYGDPREEGIIMGSMIDKTEVERILKWLDEAEKLGAEYLLKPQRINEATITPVIMENIPAEATIAREEAFAPYVGLYKFSTLEEAIKKVNASQYGLQASIFTHDLRNIRKAYSEIEVGGLVVNFAPTFRVDNMPYGGIKKSGYGREGLKYSYEELTEQKLLIV